MANPHADHGDKRTQERVEKYGDMAKMEVPELRERAEQQGISNASQLDKDQLLEELNK